MPSAARHRPTLADFAIATAAVPPVDDRIVHQIPLADIRPSPRNPRQRLDGLAELAESLRTHGLLQPVVVGRRGRSYELIAGHRRFEAARRLGWAEIAAVVRDETDDQAYILTLVENLQREDLQPMEEAAAHEVLVRERGWSTRQVGEAIKRSHIYVSRRLRVFDDPTLAPLVLRSELPVSTAEELLREPDPEARRELAAQAAREQWNQGTARRAVAARRNVTFQSAEPSRRLPSHIRALREELEALEVGALTALARRELLRLLEVGGALAKSGTS